MESNTSVLAFHVLPFFMRYGNVLLKSSIVFFPLIYLVGILVNITFITVICLDQHLHTPMYLFLCNLAFTDLCYPNIIIPNLLYILISEDNLMSFTRCIPQIFFLFIADCSESMILAVMGYDRYVAICHPFYYHQILNKKICMFFTLFIWTSACVSSFLFVNSMLKLVFCSNRSVHQFSCDCKALINISCGGTFMFYAFLYIECLLYGFGPIVRNLMSYVKIIRVVLCIKSKDGRSKAFSTCSSHLTVMVIYYGSAISVYMMPPSDSFNVPEQILTAFYTIVVPVLNPLIYSLRNEEVKSSLRKLLT